MSLYMVQWPLSMIIIHIWVWAVKLSVAEIDIPDESLVIKTKVHQLVVHAQGRTQGGGWG